MKTKEIGEKASRARKKMPSLGVSHSLALTIRRPYNYCQDSTRFCTGGHAFDLDYGLLFAGSFLQYIEKEMIYSVQLPQTLGYSVGRGEGE